MKRVLLWALLVIAAAGVSVMLIQHPGEILLSWDDYIVRTSLPVALLALTGSVLLLYALISLTRWLWHLPTRWRERRRLKRQLKAESGMEIGMLAGEEGNWAAAEKALARSARLARNGTFYWLGAARMAHQQKAWDRRDAYLKKAREDAPEAYDIIALAEARMLRENDPLRALNLLQSLIAQGHDKAAILAEYAQLLAQQKQWATLQALLPRLREKKALPPDTLDQLTREVLRNRLAETDTLEALHALWTGLDRRWQQDPDVAAAYVRRHMELGDEQGLAGLVERLLQRHWHPALVYLYGRLKAPDALKRLQTAERWLKKHADDPVLLLTLGRLACQARVWGQSQHYLQQSLEQRPALETVSALAECVESEGDAEKAALIARDLLKTLQHNHRALPASVLPEQEETSA